MGEIVVTAGSTWVRGVSRVVAQQGWVGAVLAELVVPMVAGYGDDDLHPALGKRWAVAQ